MITVLDLDLADPAWVPPQVEGAAWVLVRHGSRVLGQESLEDLTPTRVPEHRNALTRRYASRITARSREPYERSLPPSEISIIVCTRNRPRMLHDCLSALMSLDPAPGEVLVVDNASVEGATAEVAARFDVTLVTEPEVGLDRARNRGFMSASGEVVAYVDDDARVDGRLVSALSAAFSHPDVAAVTGLVLAAELDTYPQVAFERLEKGMGKGFSRRVLGPEEIGLQAFRVGVGTNMAFRRRVLDQLGGFDPRLDVGTETRGGGDLDMFWRVLNRGDVILYEPDVLVRHVHRPDRRGLIEQLRDNGTAYAAYLEARRASDPGLERSVRRERLRWHLKRHLVRPVKALLNMQLLEFQLALAEWQGSRHGPAAFRSETIRRAGAP